MNSDQAKKLSLPTLLAQLGHHPVKSLRQGRELWYKSPFRQELDASFHTSFLAGKWIWNDFGDTGGTVVDFAMRYYQCDARRALAHLARLAGDPHNGLFPAPRATQAPERSLGQSEADTLVLRKVCPLSGDSFNGRALLDYVSTRRAVDPALAMDRLQEVHFHNTETGKTYFAVGMANQAGGYEIRNPYFKSSLGGKDVSFLRGTGTGCAAVFEGFMDYLSALTYFQSADARRFQVLRQADVVVMNSITSLGRTRELLAAGNYARVLLFLDHDDSGRRAGESLQAAFAGAAVDCSGLYRGHKDFNLFLQAHRAAGNPTP